MMMMIPIIYTARKTIMRTRRTRMKMTMRMRMRTRIRIRIRIVRFFVIFY